MRKRIDECPCRHRLLSLFAGPVLAAQQLAWWVTAKFEATDTVVESIPVKGLDRTWAAASPLREEVLGAAARAPGESLKDHAAAFHLEGDFNRDGKRDKAIVGVYRTVTGATGGFLLMLTRDGDHRWKKRALFKNPEGGFSALTLTRAGRLEWAFCLECDGVCTVKPWWRGWKLDCASEP
jgi:hypothetical protein